MSKKVVKKPLVTGTMFGPSVKVINPKVKKEEPISIPMEGLKSLAEIDTLIKSLDAIRGTLYSQIAEIGFDYYYNSSVDGNVPPNFQAVEDNASASVQLRKRSSVSALTDAEIEILNQYDLPYDTEVSTLRMFGINPKYTTDTKLLEKVEIALTGVVPEDFIVMQEEKSKRVISEEGLEKAFMLHVPKDVVHIFVTFALRMKLENPDIVAIFNDIKALILPK